MEPGIINIGFDNSVILPHQKYNQYYLLQLIKQDNFQNRDVKSNNRKKYTYIKKGGLLIQKSEAKLGKRQNFGLLLNARTL